MSVKETRDARISQLIKSIMFDVAYSSHRLHPQQLVEIQRSNVVECQEVFSKCTWQYNSHWPVSIFMTILSSCWNASEY